MIKGEKALQSINNSKKFKSGLNPDTASVEETEKVNNELYEHLIETGEDDAAEIVLDLITVPKSVKEVQSSSTDEIKKLSIINSGILEELKAIKENMFDEQDTDIKHDKETKEFIMPVASDNASAPEKTEKEEIGWFKSLLGGIIGGTLLSFFMDSKDAKLYAVALSLIKPAFKALFAGMGAIAKAAMKSVLKLLDPVISKIKAGVSFVTRIVDKLKGVIGVVTKSVSKVIGMLPDFVKNKLPKELTQLTGDKAVKSTAKVGAKASTKAGGKVISTGVQKGLTKSLGKKMPFGMGIGIGVGLATMRAQEGDYLGAGLEMASTIAGIFPGLGTALSFGIDGVILARDHIKGDKDSTENDTKKVSENTKITETQVQTIEKVKQKVAQSETPINQDMTEVTKLTEKYNITNKSSIEKVVHLSTKEQNIETVEEIISTAKSPEPVDIQEAIDKSQKVPETNKSQKENMVNDNNKRLVHSKQVNNQQQFQQKESQNVNINSINQTAETKPQDRSLSAFTER